MTNASMNLHKCAAQNDEASLWHVIMALYKVYLLVWLFCLLVLFGLLFWFGAFDVAGLNSLHSPLAILLLRAAGEQKKKVPKMMKLARVQNLFDTVFGMKDPKSWSEKAPPSIYRWLEKIGPLVSGRTWMVMSASNSWLLPP